MSEALVTWVARISALALVAWLAVCVVVGLRNLVLAARGRRTRPVPRLAAFAAWGAVAGLGQTLVHWWRGDLELALTTMGFTVVCLALAVFEALGLGELRQSQ